MTAARQGAPGATRVCPHCRETILESATVCPKCRHHLKVGARATAGSQATVPSFSVLDVDGTIQHPDVGEPWEYSVAVFVRDEGGKELSHHVVGVGALNPGERRTFSLAVEVFVPPGKTVRTPSENGG